MGFLDSLFGKKKSAPGAGVKSPEPANADDVDGLLEMLEADDDSPALKSGFTADSSSPKQVFRYIFNTLLSGTAPEQLLADLKSRGFAPKTAKTYIELIQQVVLKKR